MSRLQARFAELKQQFRLRLLRLGSRGSATLEHVEEAVSRLRRHTDLPISIGFDIRTPEQAAAIARLADGVVVGSALIDQIAKAETGEQAVDGVLSLCAALAEEVRSARH
ncbi:tryptophan synthase, alpha chain [Pseudomonas asplenii]|uniref:tryptophan synthase n=1 Tax=Pseudomonas asplenii TaxID=53407 RepID=A0A0M9GF78_9PSED|nr:tryptophan synthase, alpha chain [Pseudomonas fuscovaginae]